MDDPLGQSIWTREGSREESWSNGERFFVVQRFVNYTLVDQGVSRPGFDLPNDLAVIGPGHVPFGRISDVSLSIWFAFASSSYFESLSEGKVMPLRSSAFRTPQDLPTGVSARWGFLAGSHLPRQVVTSNDFGGARELQEPLYRALSRVPHTNVLFEVTDTTDYLGITLPRGVRVHHYDYQLEGRSPTSDLRREILIEVDTVSEDPSFHFRQPQIDRMTEFQDQRWWFTNPPVAVAVRTNAWPADEILHTAYLQRVETEGRGGGRGGAQRLFLALLLFVVAAPLLGWLYFRRKPREAN
jgi:hypothetical protein